MDKSSSDMGIEMLMNRSLTGPRPNEIHLLFTAIMNTHVGIMMPVTI